MRWPKHENWTYHHTEKAAALAWKAFEKYEQHSCLNCFQQEMSREALAAERQVYLYIDMVQTHDPGYKGALPWR